MFFAACFISCGRISASEKGETFRFSDNKDWGTVETSAYSARIRKSGSFVLDVKDTMEIDASFIQCWVQYQHFPHVKYVEASIKKDKESNSIILELKYFWNDGKVNEKLTFTSRSIEASLAYTPFVEKKTSFFTCLFCVRKPKKQPPNVEIIGLDRSIDANGALVKLGKWKQIRKPELRMASIRNMGRYVVDFIAEGNAWVSIWKWPRLSVKDNGEYPCWTKTVYAPGEKKILKYMIDLSEKDGKLPQDSPVIFKNKLKGKK